MAPTKTDIPARVVAIEGDLRSLAAKAAARGEWHVVRAASHAAESLAEVMEQGVAQGSSDSDSAHVKHRVSKSRRIVKSKASGYPRFSAVDGDLVKIGWSRNKKAEYHHRAPKSAIHLVAKAIRKLATQSQGQFSTDDLFPVIDSKDGSDVPTYQGYLVLRWFRDIGLVVPNGRSGYTVPDSDNITKAAALNWENLNTKEMI
jgi:hypothetical protein